MHFREKDELIAGIPPVVRTGIVAVQLHLGIIGVQVEHIRIAIAVGIRMRCHPHHCQPNLLERKEIWLYIIRDLKSASIAYQVDFFFKRKRTSSAKRSASAKALARQAIAVCALNIRQLERIQKAVTV